MPNRRVRLDPSSEVERHQLPVGPDQEDFLSIPCLGVATHTRCIRGHPRQGESDGIRAFLEELDDRCGWYVSFDYVPIHECGMA
jgi:hypothetical protein